MKGQRKERKEIENMMCPHALIFEKEKPKKTFPLSHHSLLYRRVVVCFCVFFPGTMQTCIHVTF